MQKISGYDPPLHSITMMRINYANMVDMRSHIDGLQRGYSGAILKGIGSHFSIYPNHLLRHHLWGVRWMGPNWRK